MALALFDRVQETTTTTGTGSVTLGGAVPGFQSFAVVGNGNTCYYTIVDGTAWEVGIGTYSTSGPTLARTTVLSNSSGTTSPITLAAGTKTIFLTYPAEKSVNLDASGNVSPLGTVSSGVWQGSTVGVAYGGTGVTTSSGANSVMIRDANQNVSINRLNQSSTAVTAAGGTTTLTAASTFSQILNGTGGQTFKLPDATTLTNTTTFEFNNNATGTLTITDNANATVGTVSSGGAAAIALLSNGTVGGTWDVHAYIPESVTWGTNSLVLGSTVITGGTWNGGTIATGYGGTGLTSYTSGGAVYANSSSTLTSGTLPLTAGGTAATTASGARTSLDVPSTTGSGASGTWGINISGNAATATNSTTTSQTNFSNLTIGGSQVLYAGNYAGYSTFSGKVTSAGNNGFANDVYYSGVRNPIWSFGNASTYGISYYQGAAGIGSYDTIGFSVNGTTVATSNNFAITPFNAYVNNNVVLNAANYNSYAPTLTGTGATGTWAINITGSAGSTGYATSVNASSSTGIQSNYIAAINTTTPGTGTYGVNFLGSSQTDYAQGITWTWSSAGTAQAGIYVQSSGGYGTKMYFGTTDSFAVGSKTSMSIDHVGTIQVPRSYLQSAYSLRAPIFYDSDDTGYYVNPNSETRIYYTSVNVGQEAPGGANSSNAGLVMRGNYNSNTWAHKFHKYDNGYGVPLYVSYTAGAGAWTAAQGWGPGLSSYTSQVFGSLAVDSGLYTNIFYDKDNTAYYLDPNSGSVLYYMNMQRASGGSDANGIPVIKIAGLGDYSSLEIGVQSNYDAQLRTYGNNIHYYAGHWRTAGTAASENHQQYWYTSQSGSTNWSSWKMQLDANATLYVTGSIQSPIFYDYNNTGYYVDPSSLTYLYQLTLAGGGYFRPNNWIQLDGDYGIYSAVYNSAHFLANTASTYTQWRIIGSRNSYGGIYDTYSSVNGMMYDSSGNGGVYREANGRWYWYYALSADCMGIGTSSTSSTYSLYLNKGVYAQSRIDAPIFYDSNDTSYYGDFGSTTVLNNLNVAGTIQSTNGNGFIRLYGNLHIDAYNSNDIYLNYYSGRAVRMYYGSQTLGFLANTDGIVYAYTQFRTPFIYDTNDTGYYLDMNGTSQLSTVYAGGNIRGSAGVTAGNASISSGYGGFSGTPSNGYLITTNIDYSTFNMPLVIVEGFAYGNGVPINLQIVWYSYGGSFVSQSYTNLGAWNPGTVRIGTNSSGKICIHFSNNIYYGRMNVRAVYDQGAAYLLDWTVQQDVSYSGLSRVTVVGVQQTVGGINTVDACYMPIMYDVNNTGYYVDPASTSRMNAISVDSLYSYGNVTAYSDERLKTDWEVLPADFVEKLAKVKSGTYTRIDSGERQVGVGAQSLQVILKEAVSDSQEYLGVNYGNAALASAVELAKYVTALEERIKQLEARL